MLDKQERTNDDAQAARDIGEDLELTDETAAEITGGDGSTTGTGRASFNGFVIKKTSDAASPVFFQSA